MSLTPGERRGAAVVLLLLALGAAHDLLTAGRMAPPAPVAPADPGAAPTPGNAGSSPAPASGAFGAAAPLDLNRASAEDLDALPGIGPVLAARIVDYRSAHGPFRRIEELRAVRGIGPRLFARLRPLLADPARADSERPVDRADRNAPETSRVQIRPQVRSPASR